MPTGRSRAALDERLGPAADSYWGLILGNVAFRTGYWTFVLSTYMKALPHEMYEAARVDGPA